MSSKTTLQHASETITTLTPDTLSQALPSSLLKARQSLHTPSRTSLPHNWVVCTITLSPITHHTHRQYLLVSKLSEEPKTKKTPKSRSKQNSSLFLKVPLPNGGLDEFLRDFDRLQERVGDSVEPCEIRKWWEARRQLDSEMKVSSVCEVCVCIE